MDSSVSTPVTNRFVFLDPHVSNVHRIGSVLRTCQENGTPSLDARSRWLSTKQKEEHGGIAPRSPPPAYLIEVMIIFDGFEIVDEFLFDALLKTIANGEKHLPRVVLDERAEHGPFDALR